MITYQLPRKIRFIPASGLFTATFNTPTVGKYNFNNQQQVLIEKLLPNSVYLIDSFAVSGNVAQEDFLSSINTVPLLNLRKTLDNENIFDVPLEIQNYTTDRQIVHFFKTGQSNCGLCAALSGILDQVPNFLGVTTISLSIEFSIHAVDASDFEKIYRKEQ